MKKSIHEARYIIIGILFPVRVTGIKKRRNRNIIVNNLIFVFLILALDRKIKKKINFCKYPPAIFSSPKKPDGLLDVTKLPNKSLPKVIWIIISAARKNEKKEQEIIKNLKLKLPSSINLFMTKKNSKNLKKKIDLKKFSL